MVAEARTRSGRTTFQLLTPMEMEGEIKASVLRTLENTARRNIAQLQHEREREQGGTCTLTGARLSKMTQSTLCKGILRERKDAIKQTTYINLDMTRHAVYDLTKSFPSDKQIWKSLCKKEFGVQTRAFLWKSMHDAYKIRKYWDRINNYQERRLCSECNTVEMMEHILTECQATGQETVWRLTEKLCELKKILCTRPSMGMILGCRLADFKTAELPSKRYVGANRLFVIVMSKSVHMIWKLRCDWKIGDNGDQNKKPTNETVEMK